VEESRTDRKRDEDERTSRDVGHESRFVDRAHVDFLAMLIHEVRNPLAAVRGFAQLMHRRDTYDERAVAMIIEEADQMWRLLQSLQDATSIETGRLQVSRRRTDLVSLVRACANEAKALAAGHTVTCETTTPLLEADVDPDRVRQIVQNLLSNAIKYTSDGGTIGIRVEAWSGLARISVRDDGIGIAADALPSLFDSFWRGVPSPKRTEGLGLGLFIASELVGAHGGEIWAQSDGPGMGSTFIFTLPLTPVMRTPQLDNGGQPAASG
jgi:signal transduction histidine kinase